MKFGKVIIASSYTRELDFDSVFSTERKFRFDCVTCSSKVELEIETIIGKEYTWRDSFDESTREQIKQYYGMNIVGKAPDGGWTAIDSCRCHNCSTRYLIYAGVSEYANSAHKITFQGITEIIDEPDRNSI